VDEDVADLEAELALSDSEEDALDECATKTELQGLSWPLKNLPQALRG